jgi:hypothetical protein
LEIHHEFCKAVDSGKEIRLVFLDISKAFDRVWQKGLIFKLKQAGISGGLLSWLYDYLSDRVQRVVVNGQTSEWTKIKAGVSQGSVLGPLLFLIFINDIIHVVRNCRIRLFADDTCLFIEIDNRERAATMVDIDLSAIHQWSLQWLVSFCLAKKSTKRITKEMLT